MLQKYNDLLDKIDWLYEHTEGTTNEYIHDIVKLLQEIIKGGYYGR